MEGSYSAYSDQWPKVMFKMIKQGGSDKVELFKLCTVIKDGKVDDIQFIKLKSEMYPLPKYREVFNIITYI